jgi:hypothetical protein
VLVIIDITSISEPRSTVDLPIKRLLLMAFVPAITGYKDSENESDSIASLVLGALLIVESVRCLTSCLPDKQRFYEHNKLS